MKVDEKSQTYDIRFDFFLWYNVIVEIVFTQLVRMEFWIANNIIYFRQGK